jgi:predicted DNA-binding protein
MKDKWGEQNFLNGVHSRDDGWYKLGLEFENDDSGARVNSKFTVSDCSNKISLDFGVSSWRRNVTMKEIKDDLEYLAERRAKAELLHDAIEAWYEEITDRYNKYEEALRSMKVEAKKNAKKKKKD